MLICLHFLISKGKIHIWIFAPNKYWNLKVQFCSFLAWKFKYFSFENFWEILKPNENFLISHERMCALYRNNNMKTTTVERQKKKSKIACNTRRSWKRFSGKSPLCIEVCRQRATIINAWIRVNPGDFLRWSWCRHKYV